MDYHTPRNRLPQELPILAIQVIHAHGVAETDPNGAAASAMYGATGEDLNGAPGTAGLEFRIIPLADLAPVPGAHSMLSGGPALIYRSADVEIAMSPGEMHRLFDLSLAPEEYFAIRDRYGLFHEIHEDFYDPDTGEMFQPVTGLPLRETGGPSPRPLGTPCPR